MLTKCAYTNIKKIKYAVHNFVHYNTKTEGMEGNWMKEKLSLYYRCRYM